MEPMSRGRRQNPPAGPGRVAVAGVEHRVHHLRPGVLDEVAIACFSQGQCHALALAVSERTGWPLVALCDLDDGSVVHLGVRTPEGRILDAAGAHDPEAHCEAWDAEPREVSAAQALALAEEGTWREPALEAASSFVDAVLAYHGGERPSGAPGPLAAGALSEKATAARVRRSDGVFVEVCARAIDEPALRALYRGREQSGALAAALWLELGRGEGEIVVVGDADDEPAHVALRLADGRMLDIDGACEHAEFCRRWPGAQRTVRRPSALDEELADGSPPWPAQDLAAAELLVEPVLVRARLRAGVS